MNRMNRNPIRMHLAMGFSLTGIQIRDRMQAACLRGLRPAAAGRVRPIQAAKAEALRQVAQVAAAIPMSQVLSVLDPRHPAPLGAEPAWGSSQTMPMQ